MGFFVRVVGGDTGESVSRSMRGAEVRTLGGITHSSLGAVGK